MIKDKQFKCLFIPLIGLLIPFGASLFSASKLSAVQAIFTLVFFVFSSHLLWQGTVHIVSALRTRKGYRNKMMQKLSALLLITALFGAAFTVLAAGIWQLIVVQEFIWAVVMKAAAIATGVVVMLTLVYECLFLSAELNVDELVMLQLEQERLQAQSSVLQNELDPHFLFNSLNALSYLVQHDQKKAYQFVHKLSNVFKYLLLNKQKDFVSLEEELCFLEDYYFLLQVRFDDSIQIRKLIDESAGKSLVLPCTLQALVENAIKHNFFSDNEPLIISIDMSLQYITVANTIRPKPYKAASTNTGLNNLRTRYQLLTNKNIIVQKTANKFLVKVPIEGLAA